MTTLSSEAERLADKCARWDISDSDKDDIADLLRRIPELEAERDQLRAALSATQPAQAQQSEPSPASEQDMVVYQSIADGYKTQAQQAVEPYAYAVYFPDQPTEVLVHDLEELTDDTTNREHTVTKLYDTTPPAPAQPAAQPVQPVHGVPDARRIALTIIEDLEGRRGVLDGVDDDVKQEMLDTFAEIIEAASPTPPAQQPEAVPSGLHEKDIYDFAGWLTSRPGVMEVGCTSWAYPMADAVVEYIKTFPERFAPG